MKVGREIKVEMPKPLVHGHRGARARRPENTIPAFEMAIAVGADAIEMDLAVTRDGVIVISHDPILGPPLCRGPIESAVIRELTLQEVKQWDCGSQPHPSFPGQQTVPGARVPTLDEVFGLADKGDFDFNLETKLFADQPEYAPDPDIFAEMIVSRVRHYKLEHRVIVASFDFRSLLAVNERAPEIRLSALIENPDLDFLVAAVEARADIVSPNVVLVHSDNVEAAHSAGLQVIPWTANTIQEWKTLVQADVDGIITDDPAALINYLRAS